MFPYDRSPPSDSAANPGPDDTSVPAGQPLLPDARRIAGPIRRTIRRVVTTGAGVLLGGAVGVLGGCTGGTALVRGSSAGVAGGGDGVDALVMFVLFLAGVGAGAGAVTGGLLGYRAGATVAPTGQDQFSSPGGSE
jgi:hypothetical protein